VGPAVAPGPTPAPGTPAAPWAADPEATTVLPPAPDGTRPEHGPGPAARSGTLPPAPNGARPDRVAGPAVRNGAGPDRTPGGAARNGAGPDRTPGGAARNGAAPGGATANGVESGPATRDRGGATRAGPVNGRGGVHDALLARPDGTPPNATYGGPPGRNGSPDHPTAGFGAGENTGTFSRVLLTGLGGSPEPAAPGQPPPAAREAGAKDRAVATTRRLAARVAALRGDERTAMLAVGAVVGVVLLMLAILVVVVRLAGGHDDKTPAPAVAAPASASAAATATAAPTPSAEPTPTGSPLPPSGGSFTSRHSNLCLAAPQGRTDAGAQLVQRSCGTDFGTGFLLVAKDQPDTYELVNSGTSRCADVLGASMDDGAPVVQWDCNGGANETFQLRPLADTTGADTGYVQIVAVHSGKCLDVTASSAEENAPIQQYACRDPAAEIDPAAGNQSWKFTAD
jgi:Na+-transporting methylmalonyl-CoA/oxaloacetate decarboxylase gamma subunit